MKASPIQMKLVTFLLQFMGYLLHMYLGEQLIDSVEINLTSYGTIGKIKLDLTEKMRTLRTKYASLIKESNVQPTFWLGNIPSAINYFRSLKDQNGG